MLVLRKEIKIGIGAGLTILGIAAVYGLIAALSSNGVDHSKDTASANVSTQDGKGGLTDNSRDGLPPKMDEPDAPVVKKVVDPTPPGRDPFAESNRKDGNLTTDPWASALGSGKVNNEIKQPTVIKSPTEPKTDAKLVVGPRGGDSPPITPVDGKRKTPTLTDGLPPKRDANSGKYVVVAGDTFSTISNKVYGSKKYYSALVKANPDVNPSRLRIGHEITVPPKEQVASVGGAIEPDAAKLSAPIDTTRQYRIATGDTLSHIATKLYGKSTMWTDLYEANKTAIGPDAARLKVGTLIDLPQKPVR